MAPSSCPFSGTSSRSPRGSRSKAGSSSRFQNTLRCISSTGSRRTPFVYPWKASSDPRRAPSGEALPIVVQHASGGMFNTWYNGFSLRTAAGCHATIQRRGLMADVMIEARDLTKYYGDFLAIEDITFQVEKGEIVGVPGPQRLRQDHHYAHSDRLHAALQPAALRLRAKTSSRRPWRRASRSGTSRRRSPVHAHARGGLSQLHGQAPRPGAAPLGRRIDEVIDLVHVAHYRDTLISKLSKATANAWGWRRPFSHEPQVLILDEPTIGIDPIQVVETRQLIKDLGREHTLLLSSHILHEVSTVCPKGAHHSRRHAGG